MALEALIDTGVRFAGDTGRDHFEVHHVMAGRGLMALGAISGTRRRMLELRNRPTIGGMALGTVLPKQLEVPVIIGVARSTVEDRFIGRNVRVR